jgi:hypothetical protein
MARRGEWSVKESVGAWGDGAGELDVDEGR